MIAGTDHTAHSCSCLESLLPLIPDIAFTVDKNGHIVAINRVPQGLSRSDVIGQDCVGYAAEDCRETIREKISRVFSTGERDRYTCKGQGPNGRQSSYETSIGPVFDNDGKVRCALLITRDVTESKQIDRELAEANQRFTQLAKLSRTFMWEVDASGLYTYVSDTIEDVLGYTPQEIIGEKHFYDITPPESREQLKTMAFEVFRAKEAFHNLENMATAKAGKDVWLLTNGMPVTDHNGDLKGYRGMDTDISELKSAEAEAKTAREKAYRAQKMESIGLLAAGIAHDFNNMLSIIMTGADMIERNISTPDRVKASLDQINNATRLSADMTKRLLSYSKKMSDNVQRIDINHTIEQALPIMQRMLGANITLEWEKGDLNGQVTFPENDLNQILINLIVNARDAMEAEGDIRIETSASAQSNGREAVISVTDTGCGMDTETMKNIFEPFYTTKERGKGTGLGLSSSKQLLEKHGGRLEAESTPAQGSTFRVFLPLSFGQNESPEVAEQGLFEEHTGNETILLVEDEEMLLDLIAMVLNQLGYNVLTANNSREALELAGDYGDNINLLLTDMVMPKGNGLELYENLAEKRPQMKPLVMSGYLSEHLKEIRDIPESISFLEKPFAPDTLAKRVREVLDGTPIGT